MSIKTVGQLIEKLKEFDENSELDIDVSWYDRHNYNHAHRDIWSFPNSGIEVYVTEDSGVVTIANENTKDIEIYD